MTIIEQATKRLEELRRAGVAVPWVEPGSAAPPTAKAPVAVESTPTDTMGAAVLPLNARPAAGRLPGVMPAAPVDTQVESKQVQIDLSRLQREGYLTPDSPRRGLSEEFRAIKLPLVDAVRDGAESGAERSNLILVTSAVPGEGKTFTAINLAMSIAMEVDFSVLLVDADVLRPTLMERLGVPAQQGLLDVLANPSLDLSEVMLRTNVPKLSLLPAGHAVAKSTELLGSAAMERLLDEMAQRYPDRVIIFDAPPILATTESRVLATRMGQVVMVVESTKTPRGTIAEAFNAVEACPMVASVLNKWQGEGPHAGGYGTYHG